MNHSTVPNIIHFIYFGGRPFHLINYLAVKSAYKVNKPEKILFHYDKEPQGTWWEESKPYLTLVERDAPTSIANIPIKHPAHKADVARLNILLNQGGIYLDIDVLCHKPFTPFLEYPVVMGEEKLYEKTVGLGNAVIIAQKDSLFLKRWLDGFDPDKSLWRGFRSEGFDKYYSEMSIKYSHFLANYYPEEIHVVDRYKFFYPNYTKEELDQFFTTNKGDFTNSFSFHLWANAAWESYLKDLTPEKIRQQETNFATIAKNFLD